MEHVRVEFGAIWYPKTRRETRWVPPGKNRLYGFSLCIRPRPL
jgi:hypothetical protein